VSGVDVQDLVATGFLVVRAAFFFHIVENAKRVHDVDDHRAQVFVFASQDASRALFHAGSWSGQDYKVSRKVDCF